MKVDPNREARIAIATKLGWRKVGHHWISPDYISYDSRTRWTLKRAFNPWTNGSDDAFILKRAVNVLNKREFKIFMRKVELKWTYHSVTGSPRWWKYRVGDYADAFYEAIK